MPNDADLLQRFVDSFARFDDMTCSHEDPPPPELSAGLDPDDWNILRWRPAAIATAPAALSAIRRAGPLPEIFEQFVLSYRWLPVELERFRLLPNPPAADLRPLAEEMFADPVLNNTLLPAGFVRFALAPNECYDPICFDLNRFAKGDCPIVRINHESVLMHDTLGEIDTIFGSFRELVNAVVAMKNSP